MTEYLVRLPSKRDKRKKSERPSQAPAPWNIRILRQIALPRLLHPDGKPFAQCIPMLPSAGAVLDSRLLIVQGLLDFIEERDGLWGASVVGLHGTVEDVRLQAPFGGEIRKLLLILRRFPACKGCIGIFPCGDLPRLQILQERTQNVSGLFLSQVAEFLYLLQNDAEGFLVDDTDAVHDLRLLPHQLDDVGRIDFRAAHEPSPCLGGAG